MRLTKPLRLCWTALTIYIGCSCVQPLKAQMPIEKIVQTADKLLAVLSNEQRQKVLYAFDDEQQRARWSNFPTPVVPRGGINLKQMTTEQRGAVMDLLATVLSPMGLEKVNQIRMADDDYRVNGTRKGPQSRGPQGGPGGPPPTPQGATQQGGGGHGPGGRGPMNRDDLFGSDLYYISFLGKPSTTTPWMLQFGGHHLALNITISGTKV